MGELNFCTITDVITAINNQLIGDITTDHGLPYFLIRLFHNKLFSWLFMSARCFALYSDFWQIAKFLPFILIPAIGYAFIGKKWRKRVILIHVIISFLFICNLFKLNLQQKIFWFQAYYWFLSFVGVYKWMRRREA